AHSLGDVLPILVAQELVDFPIEGLDARLAVDHQDDHVGLLHGQLGVPAALHGQVFGGLRIDAARVHNGENAAAPAALAVEAVPGDARLILHDGDAPAD